MDNTPQQQSEGAVAEVRPAKPVVIRIDRSRDFSEVHGDRPPGDTHAKVFFYQDGLPFGADGKLVTNHPEIEESPRLKRMVERLSEKAAKKRRSAPGDFEDEDEEDRDLEASADEDENEDDGAPVSLEAWARGTMDYKWQDVSDAIAGRFSKRATNKKNALEILIEERVISMGALSNLHKRLVRD